MIWRYKAIFIENVTPQLSTWGRILHFILFWKKPKTNIKPQIAMDNIEAITTEGFIEAPDEQYAIFQLMYYDKLYPIEIEQINGHHARMLAKRIMRLQKTKNKIEKQI